MGNTNTYTPVYTPAYPLVPTITYSKTNTEKSDNTTIYSELMGDNFKNQIKEFKNKLVKIEYDKPHVLTGKDFKIKFNSENKFFVRYMNDSMRHYKFTYKEGLNEDTIPFNPSGDCESGGLYFTTVDYVHNFKSCTHPNHHIRLVEIPDDAQVYVVPMFNKWKADKIIIGEKISQEFFKVYQTVKDIEGLFD